MSDCLCASKTPICSMIMTMDIGCALPYKLPPYQDSRTQPTNTCNKGGKPKKEFPKFLVATPVTLNSGLNTLFKHQITRKIRSKYKCK